MTLAIQISIQLLMAVIGTFILFWIVTDDDEE